MLTLSFVLSKSDAFSLLHSSLRFEDPPRASEVNLLPLPSNVRYLIGHHWQVALIRIFPLLQGKGFKFLHCPSLLEVEQRGCVYACTV